MFADSKGLRASYLPLRLIRVLFVALAFFICLTTAQNTFAANYDVTRIDDRNAVCASGTDCSLREAVVAANATAAVADTITFNIPAASCNPTTNVCTITLVNTEIAVNSAGGSLTINGTGANRLTIDGGAGTNRIFYSNAATFTLSGVTLTGGGSASANFSGNGGAIFVNGGTTTISGVYFNANTAANGGGIYFLIGTNHRVENSTFSGNAAGSNGGGIFVSSASLTVVNTTLTGNTAGSFGGGIIATGSGTLTLRSDTITANTANFGGGVYREIGTLDFGNTIIAGNTGTSDFTEIQFASGTATSQGFNLVGDSAGDSTATFRAIMYQPTDIRDTPPLLGALTTANGGTTPTHALMTGSPAIDKGFSFGLTTDQRGFTRPFDNPGIPNATGGDGADIGAFEVQAAPTAASVSVGGRVLTPWGGGLTNAIVILSDAEGNTRMARTSSFGYYRFDDVLVGETYIVSVTSKRYSYAPRFVTVLDELADLDFKPEP